MLGMELDVKGYIGRRQEELDRLDPEEVRRWADPGVRRSNKDLVEDASLVHSNQALVSTFERISEVLVIEAEKVEHRRVDVTRSDRVLRGRVPEVVRCPKDGSSTDTTAGHPE